MKKCLVQLLGVFFLGLAGLASAQPTGFPHMDLTPAAGLTPKKFAFPVTVSGPKNRSFSLDPKSKLTRGERLDVKPLSRPTRKPTPKVQ